MTNALPPSDRFNVTVDERAAADTLFITLYTELHRLARRELRRRGPLGGFGVTTLLHEAYLSISGKEGTVFVDHARFMGYAARVMRGLIIDDVRRRRSEKRGGLFHITSLDTDLAGSVASQQSLLEINDALDELATVEPELAEIIELKFFCGFSFAEIAAMRVLHAVARGFVQAAQEVAPSKASSRRDSFIPHLPVALAPEPL